MRSLYRITTLLYYRYSLCTNEAEGFLSRVDVSTFRTPQAGIIEHVGLCQFNGGFSGEMTEAHSMLYKVGIIGTAPLDVGVSHDTASRWPSEYHPGR